uniref:Uncharacterized protein n=1 Tax=Romanomermis culicivorax TaxID=13658 RepID=A0A915HLH8_ROMCU
MTEEQFDLVSKPISKIKRGVPEKYQKTKRYSSTVHDHFLISIYTISQKLTNRQDLAIVKGSSTLFSFKFDQTSQESAEITKKLQRPAMLTRI